MSKKEKDNRNSRSDFLLELRGGRNSGSNSNSNTLRRYYYL